MCRGRTPPDGIQAVVERHDGTDEHEHRSGGRQIGRRPDPELAGDGPALLAEPADETGAPALTGFVPDGDTVFAEGFSAGGGHRRACPVREAAEAYCEDDDEDLDAEFPPPEAAARAAAVRARDVGLPPDPSGLPPSPPTA